MVMGKNTNKNTQMMNFYGEMFMKIFVARTNITIQWTFIEHKKANKFFYESHRTTGL
jgi:hypothetical protein